MQSQCSMAEYTNRVAPKPGTTHRDSRRDYTGQPYNENTLRIHKGGRPQVRQGWSDIEHPLENYTDAPAKASPMDIRCFFCHEEVTTELRYASGGLTWVLACLFAATGGFLGCCLLPFFIKRFKDVLHSCPKCQANLAVYYRV